MIKFFILLSCTLSLAFLTTLTVALENEKGFAVNDLKIAVTSDVSGRKLYESISYPSSIEEPIHLAQGDDLKMIFVLQDKQTNKGIQPHQALVILTSEKTGNQVPLIVRVRINGKSKFELDMKSPPKEILSSPGNYSFNLVIGTFSHNHPLNYHIGTVEIDLPSTPEKTNSQVGYGPKPEISHIFRSSEKLPPLFLSYTFVLFTLIPWIFLIISWANLEVNISLFKKATVPSLIIILLFLSSIVAIEILLYNYWTHLNIFETLLWLTGLSVMSFITGQKTLSNVQEWRLSGVR
ncbi:hypothetical protein Glove_152g15 [Diversispora epigaea]|uniref:Ribophorin II n=1 Tax=Diversispora epigaea TaxID=1348612 RepID=A0A397ISU4_9GLOM|nr:hypothetical protein Glove_152g15 [Diversispora epigaea]